MITTRRETLGALVAVAGTVGASRVLSGCFARRPLTAAFARMLAYNGMVPRAVQQGVTGITTRGWTAHSRQFHACC